MERLSRPVEWIGHRGAPREFPENSLPAFERAIERGADAVELDVHSTADGIVVVHHDPTLASTVDAVLRGMPIDGVSWSELQTVEVAPGVTIPTLAQVLDVVGSRAKTYVEIKGARIESLVIDSIRGHSAHCAIHSFDYEQIARAARLAPELRRGILLDDFKESIPALMKETQALDVWPAWRLIDDGLLETVHTAGGRVIAWTVNTAAVARKLGAAGVDGICTDDIRFLHE